jgi:hypothetical protein
MVQSSSEMLGIVGELFTRRAPMVCGKAAQRAGVPLKVFMDRWPKHLKLAWATVVALHSRYQRGEYLHEDRDVGVIEAFCNYLITLHAEAGGHPVRAVKLVPHTMKATVPCMPHTYEECLITTRQQIG